MLPIKLVADFDGVLTELNHEAARVLEIFKSEWLKEQNFSKDVSSGSSQVEQWFQKAREALRNHPEQNGWHVHDLISAYSDEDYFIYVNSLAAWLDQQVPSGSLNRFESYKDLAQHAYQTMVDEVMKGTLTPIDPLTKGVLDDLTSQGGQVVVVSNSSTDRIVDIFKKNNVTDKVQIRGSAMKFALDPERQEWVDYHERKVNVARPQYETILREEQPTAVIGDVFSLDLALPFALAEREPELFPHGLRVCLRVRDYTPDWSKKLVGLQRGRVKVFAVHALSDLKAILNTPL
jgi:phosphoglycolate phosphatase-like HAD superfamily hydrolase